MKDKIKINLHSKNIKGEQKTKLKQFFPEVFNEEKIDFEKLKLSLGENVDIGRERYGMNWPGKAQAIKVAQLPSDATLKPDVKASVDFDTTKNLFIGGDNLEVLKLLQKSYFGKIKMCYLDPPYNTGKEFIYPDKYEEGLQTYLQYTGQVDAEGKKFSTNVEADGRFHSNWMNMMWPRLFLARNLLTGDGVIFISIGDDEVSNLQIIMNEIFGEENKVGLITRIQKRGGNKGNYFNPVNDYILVYAKNINELDSFTTDVDEKIYNKTESEGSRKGEKYAEVIIYMPNLDYRPNQRFYVTAPDGSKIIPPENKSFRWTEQRFLMELKNNNVAIKKSKNSLLIDENGNQSNWIIYQKRFLIDTLEKETARPNNLFEDFQNMLGSKELENLGIPFDYPKPVNMLKHIIKLSKTRDNDIILDFFAGSGTTAHAVMELNAEDGGNRKFIMVQLPEKTDEESEAYKAGYKDITEIGEERIRKAGKKILEENKDKDGFNADKFDKGFKVFKLDKSNFAVWDGATDGDIQKKLELHVNNTDPKSKEADILYEILVKAGFELSEKVEEIKIDGKNVYSASEGQLLICLESKLDKDFVRSLAEKKPKQFICLNSSFKEDADLTNTAKILENNQIEFRTI